MQTLLPKLHPLTPMVTSVITRMPTEPAKPGLHYYVESKAEWTTDDVRQVLSDCLHNTSEPVTLCGPRTSPMDMFKRRLHEIGTVPDADRDRLYDMGYNVIARLPGLGVCLMDDYVSDGRNRRNSNSMADMYGLLRMLMEYSKFLRRLRFVDQSPPHDALFMSALTHYFKDQMALRSTLNLVAMSGGKERKLYKCKFNFQPFHFVDYGFLWEGPRPHRWIVTSEMIGLLNRMRDLWPDLFTLMPAEYPTQLVQLIFNGEISFATLMIIGDYQILDHES